jgi:hypothetical protein
MKKLLILLIGILFYNNLCSQKYTETYINDANKVAIEWFSQINSKQYEQAYKNLSETLKNLAAFENWLEQMSMLMDEFGDIESRKVTSTYFSSELEGYEDGFYVTIEYDVKYSETKNHTESLLLKQSDRFKWEVLDFNYTFQSLKTKE